MTEETTIEWPKRHRKTRHATLSVPPVPAKGTYDPELKTVPLDLLNLTVRGVKEDKRPLTIYVGRLAYLGVPKVTRSGSKGQSTLSLAGEVVKSRLPMVVQVREFLDSQSNIHSASTGFGAMKQVFRALDGLAVPVELTPACINTLRQHTIEQCRQDPASHSKWSEAMRWFRRFLRWLGRSDLADTLPVPPSPRARAGTPLPYTDDEFRAVVRDLFTVFNSLGKKLKANEVPEQANCPFSQPAKRWAVNPQNTSAWQVKFVSCAFFLVAAYTGKNTSNLIKLRRTDVAGHKYQFDKALGLYRLVSEKGRQGGKENPVDVGFTKRGLDFLNAYFGLLEQMDLPEDTWLFPRIMDGVYTGKPISLDSLAKFNKWFLPRCAGKIQPVVSRFRKTKSEGLYSATGSLSLVAEGLNNELGTVARAYVNGNPHENNNRLGSAAEAIELIARGETLEKAREAVEATYGKARRLKDMQQTSEKVPRKTKIGTRCKDPFGEKAKRAQTNLEKAGLVREGEEVPCFQFLDCFKCEHRALVAEVDDIWCMLSFLECLVEALIKPTINHSGFPVDKVRAVIKRVRADLGEVECNYPEVYAEARAKFNNETHPLWDDEDAAQDFYSNW
ncbi:hypothetical protein KUV89_17735 [Marinobacter hydrocarbonoclasticus]|nr:hypothetical protein [Marinobacter nauticus]